jgi:Type IV secretion system pilin
MIVEQRPLKTLRVMTSKFLESVISIVIAWAGFNYMVSGGNPGKRAQANGILTKAVIGIFFIVAAWLIVQFIVKALGVNTGAIVF